MSSRSRARRKSATNAAAARWGKPTTTITTNFVEHETPSMEITTETPIEATTTTTQTQVINLADNSSDDDKNNNESPRKKEKIVEQSSPILLSTH
jgi:hypothetical protein